jgi:hypothetical protein
MLEFPKPAQVNGLVLIKELEAAGYVVDRVTVVSVESEDDTVRIVARTATGTEIDERSRDAIQAVLDVHAGEPDEEQLRPVRVRAKVEAGIERLEGDAKDAATWNGLTAARRQENARISALMVAKLARIVLERFDVPEA